MTKHQTLGKLQISKSKSQIPIKFQISNPKPTRRRFENWSLGFFWNLGFGIWSFLLVLSAFLNQASAQTNSTRPAPSNRYLLIVETSRAMERRADGVLSSAQTLLNSAFGGQLRRGDTVGVWTYNDELHAGELPLQQWSPEAHPAVVRRTVSFLQQQKCQNSARIDKVFPAIIRLVQEE